MTSPFVALAVQPFLTRLPSAVSDTRYKTYSIGKTFHFVDKRRFSTGGSPYFHSLLISPVPLEHKNQDVFVPVRPGTCSTATRCTMCNFIFRAYDAAGELWTITRHRVDIPESGLSLRKLLATGTPQPSVPLKLSVAIRLFGQKY